MVRVFATKQTVDKFNDLYVTAFVTAGMARLLLLHDARNEDGIRAFLSDVHELYLKVSALKHAKHPLPHPDLLYESAPSNPSLKA
eukprot:7252262-Pyramimonas_sp.AAC.2